MRTRLPLWTLLGLGLGLASLGLCADPPKDDGKAKEIDPAADINKPRADARRIAFTATESTWMSLDVSPDGQTIVFDCSATFTRFPSPAARRARSRAVRPSTRTRASPRTAGPSPSRATEAASRTPG